MADHDRLARWLYERYGRVRSDIEWDDLPRPGRLFWQHEADTVTKALIRLSVYKIVHE